MTRRTEILERMKAYEDDRAARKAAWIKENKMYNAVISNIGYMISISIFHGLGLSVYTHNLKVTKVDVDIFKTTIEVRYEAQENEEIALAWKMTITRNHKEDTISITTDSISSINCNSKERVDDLRNSCEILYRLNDMNWREIICNVEEMFPRKSDFFTVEYDENEVRPDFESQLLECELDESAGTNIWFKLLPNEGRIEKSLHNIYLKIKKVTPSMYTVTEGIFDSTFEAIYVVGSYSIRKDSLIKKLENPTIIFEEESK